MQQLTKYDESGFADPKLAGFAHVAGEDGIDSGCDIAMNSGTQSFFSKWSNSGCTLLSDGVDELVDLTRRWSVQVPSTTKYDDDACNQSGKMG